MTGEVLSNTEMIWAQEEVFPQTSVAMYTLVIVNLFAHIMLLITSGATVIVTKPSQLSLPVIPPGLAGGTWLAH